MMSKPNQYYFTYWHGDKGKLYRPVFKVQGQLGVRWPSNCYVTLCSFGLGGISDWRQRLIGFETNRDTYWNRGQDYPYWYKKK